MAEPLRMIQVDEPETESPWAPIPVYISGVGDGGGSVSWSDIEGKPATYPPIIGTSATTAMAGNSQQSANRTPATAIAPGTATNVQAILQELSDRIALLEAT